MKQGGSEVRGSLTLDHLATGVWNSGGRRAGRCSTDSIRRSYRLPRTSWIEAHRSFAGYGKGRAQRQGDVLGALDPPPDLVMFQEAKHSALETVCTAAGLDWWHHSLEFVTLPVGKSERYRPAVALAGRGEPPRDVGPLAGVPLPEKLLTGFVDVDGTWVFIASYHAPPGVTWKHKKAQQAVAFAHRLCRVRGPIIFGADANTPKIDHPTPQSVLIHWPTGRDDLMGWPGDDVLFGFDPIHGCRDALRAWMENNPAALDEVRAEFPDGPLAISHYTGKRKDFIGIPRRYDHVWLSDHFDVEHVRYDFGDAVTACSDHALVVADLAMRR